MKLRMRDEDRRAVDMLLDRTAEVARGQATQVYAAVNGRMRESITCVEKVLGILDKMPAGDPPRDLAARTIDYVERTSKKLAGSPEDSVFNHPPIA